jgi:hypothetical protein
MLSKIVQCSSGEYKPCDETVISHHPKEKNGSLECFTRKRLNAEVKLDHTCFKGALLKEYHDDYVNYIKKMAQKWTKTLTEKVWPGRKCISWKHKLGLIGFRSKTYIKEICKFHIASPQGEYATQAGAEALSEGTRTAYTQMEVCGAIDCCENNMSTWIDTELICGEYHTDESIGHWSYTITGHECDADDHSMCKIDDIKVNINFHFRAERENYLKITTPNAVVVNVTPSELIAKLTEKARDPQKVCQWADETRFNGDPPKIMLRNPAYEVNSTDYSIAVKNFNDDIIVPAPERSYKVCAYTHFKNETTETHSNLAWTFKSIGSYEWNLLIGALNVDWSEDLKKVVLTGENTKIWNVYSQGALFEIETDENNEFEFALKLYDAAAGPAQYLEQGATQASTNKTFWKFCTPNSTVDNVNTKQCGNKITKGRTGTLSIFSGTTPVHLQVGGEANAVFAAAKNTFSFHPVGKYWAIDDALGNRLGWDGLT